MTTTATALPAAPAQTPSRRWSERRLAPFAVAACLLALAAALPVGMDDLDEGYFSEQASRVLRGELPYRDFDTLYTPGLLLLHAAVGTLLGEPHLLGLRLVSLLARAAVAGGVYALARQAGARPRWAAAAALVLVLGLDAAPDRWEPHPGWPSAAAALWATWLFGRVLGPDGVAQPARLLAAGAAIGLTFAFKQNSGAFLGLAGAGFLLLQGDRPRYPCAGVLARAVQVGALLAVLAALTWLVRPYLSPGLAIYLLAPVAATGLLLLRARAAPAPRAVAWLAGGALAFTLPWLLALAALLGGDVHRLRGFVGAVDQTGLYYPPDLPGPAVWPVLGLGVLALLLVAPLPRWDSVRLPLGLGVLALLVAQTVALTWVPAEPPLSNVLQAHGRASQGLASLLPTLAVWTTLWTLRRPPGTRRAWRRRWLLAAGVFLFLTEYPRMDLLHLAWACGPLLALGALALDGVERRLTRRWQRSRLAVFIALLVLPALAALPMHYWRVSPLIAGDASGLPRPRDLQRLDVLPVVSGLWVEPRTGRELREVVAAIHAWTAPGEPIFVYPSAPLLYVVAERPNATRISHFYPGVAPPEEITALVEELDRRQVRLVVLSEFWQTAWGFGGVREVEAYLAEAYEEVGLIGAYRVLARR